MDQQIKKPEWNITMWALAGFAILMLAVAVAGTSQPKVAQTEVQTLS